MDRFMDRANLYLSMDVNENGTKRNEEEKLDALRMGFTSYPIGSS
jgi:hypothetical protein